MSWITRERVLEWRADLKTRDGMKGRKMSEASIDTYMRRLRGFLSWCVRRRHLRENPMEEIKLGRVKVTRSEN